MAYHINIKSSAVKELEKIPKPIRLKIIEDINSLSLEPRPSGCKKLVNFDNHYRIRINNYRIIYSIDDNILTVEVIKVGHRKDVYK